MTLFLWMTRKNNARAKVGFPSILNFRKDCTKIRVVSIVTTKTPNKTFPFLLIHSFLESTWHDKKRMERNDYCLTMPLSKYWGYFKVMQLRSILNMIHLAKYCLKNSNHNLRNTKEAGFRSGIGCSAWQRLTYSTLSFLTIQRFNTWCRRIIYHCCVPFLQWSLCLNRKLGNTEGTTILGWYTA